MRKLTMEDAKALGTVLRAAREDAGLTREELARRIGMSSATVQRYEGGGHTVYGKWVVDTIPGAILQVMAGELGLEPGELLARAGLSAKSLPRVTAPITRSEATTMRQIDSAERIALRIETARDRWEEFLRGLPQESKEEFLMLMATGSVTTEHRDS